LIYLWLLDNVFFLQKIEWNLHCVKAWMFQTNKLLAVQRYR
jgi:hypothetical protein